MYSTFSKVTTLLLFPQNFECFSLKFEFLGVLAVPKEKTLYFEKTLSNLSFFWDMKYLLKDSSRNILQILSAVFNIEKMEKSINNVFWPWHLENSFSNFPENLLQKTHYKIINPTLIALQLLLIMYKRNEP